jgi:Flp pilus assembly protein TadG
MLNQQRRSMKGVATVEFYVVAILALLPLCLGIIQVALLLVANHHVDHAAYMAAREGAVSHGELSAIRAGFARAITPLYVDSVAPVDRGNVTSRVAQAYARAMQDMALYTRFRIVSPNDAAQGDFAISRDGQRVIPNDSLEYRSAALGRRSRLSLQEANILDVEVSHCRPLIVPLVRQLLLATLRRIDHDQWDQQCYAADRVPIRSAGIAPMQSDFRISRR